MIDLQGTELLNEEINLIQHQNVGSVILFARNFKNKIQLNQLIKSIHELRPDIFIAADQEGGFIQRFVRDGLRALPAPRVLGEIYDKNPEVGLQLAEYYGEIMAQDLLSLGVDLCLGPVLDLHGPSNVIGKLDRAFHSNPNIVALLAGAYIKGMKKAGMPCVGKHFPGHGSIAADSHTSLPVSDATQDTLDQQDLLPFIELIKAKLLNGLMPAHVIYKNVDPDNTCGFSKIWLQNILRDKYNFEGLIISDCLSMAGADIGNLQQRAAQAQVAGCDMLIICNQARDLLYSLLQQPILEQTEESALRLIDFKSAMQRFMKEKQNLISPYLSLTLHNPTNNKDAKETEEKKEYTI